jgi:AcrR family transcriptional regulator
MRSAPEPATGPARLRACLPDDAGPERTGDLVEDQLVREAEALLREHRIGELEVELVCAEAHVTEAAFAKLFSCGSDELWARTFDRVSAQVCEGMLVAYGRERGWLDCVRAALFDLLGFVDRERGLARFLVLDSLSGDAAMLARRRELLDRLAEALDEGSPPGSTACARASFGGEAVVHGVASVLGSCLLEEPARATTPLGGRLMGLIVLPYLGVEAARAELSKQP